MIEGYNCNPFISHLINVIDASVLTTYAGLLLKDLPSSSVLDTCLGVIILVHQC